jgi:predicted ferric reductase
MLAVIVTSLLRAKMKFESWRAVHWLSFLAYLVAIVHTLMIGTDVRFSWMDLCVVASVAAVGISLLWRIWQSPRRHGRGKTAPGSTALNRRAAADHLSSLKQTQNGRKKR